MSGSVRMGYESQLFIGNAGNTAATAVTNATDIDYNIAPERGDSTPRGDGTAPPVIYSKVTGLKPSITFKHLNMPGDANLIALIAAVKTGAAIAMRTKHYPSGAGFDGDVTVGLKQNAPKSGEGMFEFECEATNDEGRAAALWT